MNISFWLCMGLTAIILHTCLQIEYWNMRAGFFLPSEIAVTGNPKWRYAHADEHYREYLAKHIRLASVAGQAKMSESDYQKAMDRSLTGTEKNMIEQTIARNKILNTLRSWVGDMGLLQYLLAPIGVFWSLRLKTSGHRWSMRIGICLMRTACTICGRSEHRRHRVPGTQWFLPCRDRCSGGPTQRQTGR